MIKDVNSVLSAVCTQWIEEQEDAARSLREIRDVFTKFIDNVAEKTAGKIQVGFQLVYDDEYNSLLQQPERKRWRIMANSTQNQEWKDCLARLECHKRGYPVMIVHGNTEFRCHDRESLEEVLEKLLEDPRTSHKLSRILSP